MKTYLLTIKGNDTFVCDYEITCNDVSELLDKVRAIITNVSRRTIEQLHVESLILLRG